MRGIRASWQDPARPGQSGRKWVHNVGLGKKPRLARLWCGLAWLVYGLSWLYGVVWPGDVVAWPGLDMSGLARVWRGLAWLWCGLAWG